MLGLLLVTFSCKIFTLALASLISLLLSDGTCIDITFTRINADTCPLFARAQIGNNCSNPATTLTNMQLLCNVQSILHVVQYEWPNIGGFWFGSRLVDLPNCQIKLSEFSAYTAWSVSGWQCGMDYNNLSREVKSQVEVQTRIWVERSKIYTGENSRA